MTELLFTAVTTAMAGWLAWRRIKPVQAHCDTLDGPVVMAARRAFEHRDANLALIWVDPEAEAAVHQAFNRALKARNEADDTDAAITAEYAFFEYLVKAHREGEGVPYEGLKPAEVVPAEQQLADQAIASGTLDEVLSHIPDAGNRDIVAHLFHEVRQKAGYAPDDLPAGRDYVAAYTHFVHAVEPAIAGEDLSEHALHHGH